MPQAAADVPAAFAAAFNTGDLDAVQELYESQGVLVAGDARRPVAGHELREALAEHMSLGLPISVTPRRVVENGDLALLLVDWRIAGTGPDGHQVELGGTATDVVRRGADGAWRYLIDNPFGTT
ncbi:hypothetical protein Sru01_15170 [Sphaerisporangium rufum]|uniref:DUF4440 domain-containing protein n=1 Tax=Sphaerisporangium rufum TaxID=1381558 RepID=A0A919R3P1_9ACTN|nr:DUF4440 domain-containing protein [Sphaerisporangium rufum]GII76535.1 hypothetical protein Sru01_15170 [Sphaerisporangium rufum]